jgi:hypothetical protein
MLNARGAGQLEASILKLPWMATPPTALESPPFWKRVT